MGLKETQKEIYEPGSDLEKRKHEESEYNPEVSKEASTEEMQKERKWKKSFDVLGESQKKIITVAIIIVAVFVVIGIVWLGIAKFYRSSFNSDKVLIRVEGVENSESNKVVEYEIVYKNENRVSLENAEIFLNYSENFRPVESDNLQIDNSNNSRIIIGEIEPYSEEAVSIKGEFFAPQESVVYINATIRYMPSNFNSTFQAKGQLGVNIKSSPIEIGINAPLDAVTGDDVEYVINYKNGGDESFNNVRIKADYPDGFEFSSSDPEVSGDDNIWNVGNLNSGQEGKIIIRGKLNGIRNEGKIIQISVESMGENGEYVLYSREDKVTKIIASPLVISQIVNRSTDLNVNAGDTLDYAIEFKNVGEIGLRNAIVTLEIESEVIDFSDMRTNGGFFDGTNKTITWKAAEVPGLSNIGPGTSGEILLKLKVLKNIPVKDKEDKNFSVKTVAKIDSPDIPTTVGSNKIIASNELNLKLNSKVILDTLGFYEDKNIDNSGPIPPKLGEETSYALHWKITNVSNDLENVKVTSYLPTGVVWKNKVYPEDESENIEYNNRTNELIWNIGNMKNGVGIISPEKEISFQVSIVPQENQVGSNVELLKKSVLTGKDVFTGESLNIESKEKNTILQEDSSVRNNGKVEK